MHNDIERAVVIEQDMKELLAELLEYSQPSLDDVMKVAEVKMAYVGPVFPLRRFAQLKLRLMEDEPYGAVDVEGRPRNVAFGRVICFLDGDIMRWMLTKNALAWQIKSAAKISHARAVAAGRNADDLEWMLRNDPDAEQS
jgi:hypothetical protein